MLENYLLKIFFLRKNISKRIFLLLLRENFEGKSGGAQVPYTKTSNVHRAMSNTELLFKKVVLSELHFEKDGFIFSFFRFPLNICGP